MKLSKLLAALMLLGFIISIQVVNAEESFTRTLRVNQGLEIEYNIHIEVVEIKYDIYPYVKINFSSPGDPGTLRTLFSKENEVPVTYSTIMGDIKVNATSIFSDMVELGITVPSGWKITNIYEVKAAATETTPTISETVPNIIINKMVDKTSVYPEETIRITIYLKNTGNGTAKNLNLNEPAPPTGLDIVSGYPIDIENTLDAGYKVQKSYNIKATKPGNYTILPTIINYKSESGKGYSSESESLTIVVKEPEIKLPNLITVINVDKTEIVVGNRTTVSVKVTNTGKASAKDVKIDASVPEGLKIVSGDLETVFPEIKPGESKGYLINPVLEAVKNGTYIIYLKTVYGDKENTSESPKITVIEKKPEKNKDNKFMYLLILIPIILIIAWIYKVHRDYRY